MHIEPAFMINIVLSVIINVVSHSYGKTSIVFFVSQIRKVGTWIL